jgi:hypothetical protein
MSTQAVTLQLPENLYLRLQQMAQTTHQSFAEVLLPGHWRRGAAGTAGR